jgi:hypothetical protein
MGEAMQFFSALAGMSIADGQAPSASQFLNVKVMILLVAGAVLATPLAARINTVLLRWTGAAEPRLAGPGGVAYAIGNVAVLTSLFLLSLTAIGANAYNPFIYFRF